MIALKAKMLLNMHATSKEGSFMPKQSTISHVAPSKSVVSTGLPKNYHGHRARLRRKFKNSELRSLEDYELLEMLLFYVMPRSDTKPLAKALLNKFGSLRRIITAEPLNLREVEGVGETTSTLMRLLADLCSRLYLPVREQVHVLNHWSAVVQYCQLTMGQKPYESCRVLYLNSRNMLIGDEVLQNGTLDRVALYPRELVRHCLTHGAAAIILVHNHPSGDSSPSEADIMMTKNIQKALSPIGVLVHDHLIISEGEFVSMRASGLLMT